VALRGVGWGLGGGSSVALGKGKVGLVRGGGG
jgi:hypothetical protein